jgi:hypothetical protein
MIRVHCSAGVDCATYQMLAFDKNGRFIKSDDLGLFAAESESAVYFIYKILSDTVLQVSKIDYDLNADTTVDSSSRVVPMRLP